NCAAIPEALMESELFGHEKGAFTDARTQKKGMFEMADGGTLFVDEVSEMSLGMQAKLLRVLEGQSFRRVGGVKNINVDVRVVFASNRNLEEAVRASKCRQDLYFRLAIIPVTLLPLREHSEDVPPLLEHSIRYYNQKFRKNIKGLTKEAMDLLMDYSWPGNVRELRNTIERVMILAQDSPVSSKYLPIRISEGGPLAALQQGLEARSLRLGFFRFPRRQFLVRAPPGLRVLLRELHETLGLCGIAALQHFVPCLEVGILFKRNRRRLGIQDERILPLLREPRVVPVQGPVPALHRRLLVFHRRRHVDSVGNAMGISDDEGRP